MPICVFSPNLFQIYHELILGELKVLSGFMIGRQNLEKIKYENGKVLMARKHSSPSRRIDITYSFSKLYFVSNNISMFLNTSFMF